MASKKEPIKKEPIKQATIKDELSVIKSLLTELMIVNEIMNKQIVDLGAKLSKALSVKQAQMNQSLFTDADFRELAQMKRK